MHREFIEFCSSLYLHLDLDTHKIKVSKRHKLSNISRTSLFSKEPRYFFTFLAFHLENRTEEVMLQLIISICGFPWQVIINCDGI